MNKSHIVFLARDITDAWGKGQRFNMPIMKGWELSLLLNELRVLDVTVINSLGDDVNRKRG